MVTVLDILISQDALISYTMMRINNNQIREEPVKEWAILVLGYLPSRG
jgi:hypothetical protein